MDRADFDRAARFWEEREAGIKKMEPKALFQRIEEFLKSHNTCALATGSGNLVRCTPVEYDYFDKALWILSEGGLKFAGLRDNKNVSAAVYEPYGGFDSVEGLQITGTARVAEPGDKLYKAYALHKGIDREHLEEMAANLHLIAVRISRMDYVCGKLLEDGYSIRQVWKDED